MVDDASFNQDRLFLIELLVWFTGLDKLCGVCPSGTVSIRGTFSWITRYVEKLTNQILDLRCQYDLVSIGRDRTHTSAYRSMRFGPGVADFVLSFSSSFTLVTLICTSFLVSDLAPSTGRSPMVRNRPISTFLRIMRPDNKLLDLSHQLKLDARGRLESRVKMLWE